MNAAKNLQYYIDIAYNTRGVKRVRRFARKYSSQLGFTFLVFVFLTVTIGEGQANNISVPKLSAQLSINNDGFIGKPVILASQTVLTGELQQDVVIIYTVEKGDSISSIAARYNLSVGTILDKNNIKPVDIEKIAIGTKLIIPAEDTNTSLAWLESLNQARAEQRRLADAERQRQQQETTTSRNSNLSYS
ncbi:LysM peptidoglycan-binding domain-containing protein, partial [Candidatus Berkelbacteria bacterium]|nr:LysM peptidoglycan-binding domain-containing protein [Candidatus Berkelbacteria bacterium]